MANAITRVDELRLAIDHPQDIPVLLRARLDTFAAPDAEGGIDSGMKGDGLADSYALRLFMGLTALGRNAAPSEDLPAPDQQQRNEVDPDPGTH